MERRGLKKVGADVAKFNSGDGGDARDAAGEPLPWPPSEEVKAAAIVAATSVVLAGADEWPEETGVADELKQAEKLVEERIGDMAMRILMSLDRCLIDRRPRRRKP